MSRFQKATKRKARLRMALVGPAGSGKTYTALGIATRLAGASGRIAVLDSERGSASKYADIFDFDVVDMDTFSPRNYVDLIQEADAAGYDVIVIDSLSHAWMGAGGALEMVDKVAARSKSANSFAAWREVTPEHNALVDAILACRCHVIATMRTKTEWILEEGPNGKKIPRRVGMQPVQRDGLEYEFDVVADLDHENYFTVSKTRCPSLKDHRSRHSTAEVGELLIGWLEDGAEAPPKGADGSQSKHLSTLLEAVEAAGSNADLDAVLKQIVLSKKAGRLTSGEYAQVVEAGRAKRMALMPTNGTSRLDKMREHLSSAEEDLAAEA